MAHQTESSTAAKPEHAGGASNIRLVVRVILFAILLYLVCALPYDFYVARPAQLEAWKKLQNEEQTGLLDTKNNNKGEVETTNEVVAQTLGKKPSSTKQVTLKGLAYTQETYSWRGGLIFRTYDIYVTYRPKNGKLLLEHGYLNQSPYDVSAETVAEEAPLGGDPPTTTPATGGMMPGGPPSGRPGGSGPDASGTPSRPEGEPSGDKPAGEDATKKPADEEAPKKADGDEPKKPADGDAKE